jgi:TonB family protein
MLAMGPIDVARFSALTLALAACTAKQPPKSSDEAPAVAEVDVPDPAYPAADEAEPEDEGVREVAAQAPEPEAEIDLEPADPGEEAGILGVLRSADGTSMIGVGGSSTGSGLGRGFGGLGQAQQSQAQPGASTGQGSLDKDIIRRIIHRHVPAARRCYQSELKSDPSFATRVTLRFVIAASGNVSSAKLMKGSGNASFDSCLEGVAKRMLFPKPKGGGVVVVNFPFVFQSSG